MFEAARQWIEANILCDWACDDAAVAAAAVVPFTGLLIQRLQVCQHKLN